MFLPHLAKRKTKIATFNPTQHYPVLVCQHMHN